MDTTRTLQWRHSLEEAQAESRQSGKPLLIELFSLKCGGCQTMEKETFENPETIHWIKSISCRYISMCWLMKSR